MFDSAIQNLINNDFRIKSPFQFNSTEEDHKQRSVWIDGVSSGSSASKWLQDTCNLLSLLPQFIERLSFMLLQVLICPHVQKKMYRRQWYNDSTNRWHLLWATLFLCWNWKGMFNEERSVKQASRMPQTPSCCCYASKYLALPFLQCSAKYVGLFCLCFSNYMTSCASVAETPPTSAAG